MALKIRLRQQGRTHSPFYRLVVTESQTRRDGKYIEVIGWYNPMESDDDKNLSVKADRVQHWIGSGAVMTESASSLIKRAAPSVMKEKVDREVAKREKARLKRKARKKAAA